MKLQQYLYKFEAMTTPCEVLIASERKERADEIAQAILQEAKRLEKKYSYYRPDSLLSALNARTTQQLDMETRTLLQRAIGYYRRTGGVFDITVATLKDLYTPQRDLMQLEREREKLQAYVGCGHLQIKRDRLYFDNPFTKIDLGGFVKEYAVDQAVRIARKAKLQSVLVNFGGDIYALGRRSDGEKFRVGIKDPANPETYAAYVEIEDEALATSASYARFVTIGGERFSHIIGADGGESPASVTVIAANCVESGVYSTAMMIDPTLTTTNRVILL